MELIIPDSLSDSLREIGEIGGKHAYLVGGSVRDLFLKRPNFDIDIVVEGDAIRVAKQLQERWNSELQTHPQFGTATVTPKNPTKPKIDFVSARNETYQKPATLPNVEPGTISEDLLRRDFTINALAMCLDDDAFGTIIDETGGIDDINTGTIRVLHNKSYIDDPTRIFRACRYAGRYNFNIADADTLLIQEAIPWVSHLSGERIRNEIENILTENTAPIIVDILDEFGVFEAISFGWRKTPTLPDDFQSAQSAISWAAKHIPDKELDNKLILWLAFFGLHNEHSIPIYIMEALSFKLVLKHQLRRITNLRIELSDEAEIRGGFEECGILLSKRTAFDYCNGKWCIVDEENEETYVYGEAQFYRVLTPITAFRNLCSAIESLTETTKKSDIYRILKPFPLEAAVLAYCDTNLSETQRTKICDYLLNIRKIKPIVNGDDLIEWGEKPSKNFETCLKVIFDDQLDGKIKTKSDGYTRYQQLKNQERD